MNAFCLCDIIYFVIILYEREGVFLMKLNHILEGIEVLSVVGNEDVEVLNVEYDSRKVEVGTLFICI